MLFLINIISSTLNIFLHRQKMESIKWQLNHLQQFQLLKEISVSVFFVTTRCAVKGNEILKKGGKHKEIMTDLLQ